MAWGHDKTPRRASFLPGVCDFASFGLVRSEAEVADRDIVAARILIESDGPYLSPEPVRKLKVNEPAHVTHVARCLAAVRNTTVEAFSERTAANAARLLALDITA